MTQYHSLRQRLRYWFDNSFAGGPQVLIGWLALMTILFVVLGTGIVILIHGNPEGEQIWQVFWNILSQALTPNPVDAGYPVPYLLVMLVVTLGSLFMVSILIGTLTSSIERKIEDLRKGRSQVVETGHTLILGWSTQVFTVVSELMIANENHNKARIVILADKDKVEMEDELRDRIKFIGHTRIICRSGSPIDMADIEIASPHSARSIIVLPPTQSAHGEEEDPDSYVIKTVLALTNNPNRRLTPYHIVTQIRDPKNMEVVKMIGIKDNLLVVLSGELIARLVAQTSRQSGLSVVYTELLNFSGDEIYFIEIPTLAGKTFGEALLQFEDSAVIGVRFVNGTLSLNPPMETQLAAADKIIAISADDDTILAGDPPILPVDTNSKLMVTGHQKPFPEKCLLLGWNTSAAIIIRQLDEYVPKGSLLTVVVDLEASPEVVKAGAEVKGCARHLKNLRVSFKNGDTTDRALLDTLRIFDYDHIIALSYAGLEVQAADARTLVTLLHLRDIAEKNETRFSIISEMLDLRNRQLADAARVDDFIVSEHLISLMMAQLSENVDLMAVFDDLFNPQGSEIYLKPAGDYIETGKPVNFYTVVDAARRAGQVAFGYRLVCEAGDAEKSYGIHTNPKKSSQVIFNPEDKIIVLAES
jgi:voltage-gated potassium channel Kch